MRNFFSCEARAIVYSYIDKDVVAIGREYAPFLKLFGDARLQFLSKLLLDARSVFPMRRNEY